MPAHAALRVVLGILLAWVVRSGRVTSEVVGSLAAALLVQAVAMALWRLDIVPTMADRVAGDRFIASLEALPGRVLVPTHPYYLRMAGSPTHASAIGIDDLLHAKSGHEVLCASLLWSLDGVSAVVPDNGNDVQLFGRALTSQFTLVTLTFVPAGVFLPVTETPTHPFPPLCEGDAATQLVIGRSRVGQGRRFGAFVMPVVAEWLPGDSGGGRPGERM